MTQIAVSSFSLHQELGPIRISMRGADGKPAEFVWDQPQTMTLLEFPGQVRKRLGLDAIEICQFHMPERTPEYIAQLKSALSAAGVTMLSMPIDVGNISDTNDAYRAEDLAEIEAWFAIAAELGARYVRVNASRPLPGTTLAPLSTTIESYSRLAKSAGKLGLQLLIENHGGITADPEVIVQIAEAVGSDLKVLVDIGNFHPIFLVQQALMQGQVPPEIDPAPVYEAVARIAPYAGLVHAKTHGFLPDGRERYMDVVRALQIVRDAGYQGPVSLEYEGMEGDPWEGTRKTLALVRQALGA